jgi:hypothetical protein
MNNTTIKTSVKKHTLKCWSGFVYTGYITVYEGSNRLWMKSSGINRVSRADAMLDAERMQKEALSEFQL